MWLAGTARVYLALALVVLAFALVRPEFLTAENLVNVARQVSINSIIAVGMTVVIISAGIDLSVGSVAALAGVVGALLIRAQHLSVPTAMACGALAGGLAGAVNGFFVIRFSVPAFISTLAMMTVARGLALRLGKGRPIWELPPSFSWLGTSRLGPAEWPQWARLPVPVLIMAVVFLAGWFLLSKTTFGRHVYAVGGNEEAARLSGIPVKRVRLLVYSLSGLLAGLAGIVLASRLSSGQPSIAVGYELDAIAAVVLGGTSLFGGKGTMLGTLAGALIIGILDNGLTLCGVDPYWQMVVKGGVILGAVMLEPRGAAYST